MTNTRAGILNIAHRGARAFAPENTLVAFAKAKEFGCEMVELDVRLTKDAKVIVFHDENLIRCTDAANKFPDRANYNVADFSYSELSGLDAGSWYVEQLALANEARQPFLQSLTAVEAQQFISPSERNHYASGDVKIPTLAETLVLTKDLGLMVNIELKKTDNGSLLVGSVLKLITAMGMEDQILISSFEHDLLWQVRQHAKKLATGVLTDTPMKAPVTYLRKLKANAYNLGCFHDYRQDGFNSLSGIRYLKHIKKLKEVGFDVNVWTCNNQDEMGYLLTAGVTGVISDYPNRVKEKLLTFLSKGEASIIKDST